MMSVFLEQIEIYLLLESSFLILSKYLIIIKTHKSEEEADFYGIIDL